MGLNQMNTDWRKINAASGRIGQSICFYFPVIHGRRTFGGYVRSRKRARVILSVRLKWGVAIALQTASIPKESFPAALCPGLLGSTLDFNESFHQQVGGFKLLSQRQKTQKMGERNQTRVKCKTKYTTFSAGRLSKAITVHMAPISNLNKLEMLKGFSTLKMFKQPVSWGF